MNTESAVITSVCENKDISTVLAENIDEVFTSHRDVWEGLKSYYLKFKSVPDISVLTERFKDFEPVKVKGETAYYLDQLKNEYISGRLRNLLLTSGASLKTEASSRVISLMQKELSMLGKLTTSVRDVDLTDFKLAEKHFEAVKTRSDIMGGSPGILTGFKAIDYAYPTGMAPGHLIVMIGWPGRGKTWLSSYLACKAWEQGFKPMIISLEMTPENMRDRIYTMMGSGLFKASDFARGAVDIQAFDDWGTKKFADKNQFILVSNEGAGEVTPSTVQAKIDQHKPDIVILDYHQLFADNQGSKAPTERNMNISKSFKALAMNNNIPIIDITAATMDDTSDQDGPPLLSQVAWSKAIEYDADMAIAVHKQPDSNIMEVVSRKNRHGTEFGFYLDWDLNRGIVTEVYDKGLG
ncbi:DnaB Replicative DNA helicase [uncultured Caudovirales phage]|uniref:DnaB Replicative DNA helicase n=1 Tax=uncultured Caudovirales phage TaxID=2100421 RepID=A0A6J7WJL0_9CAUD|nr:DnaB Replicative DNA helicase [uncultured Caudovirales phage]